MSQNVPDVIQQALDFEEKGAQYYQSRAQSAQNPLVKRLFLALAVEEGDHQVRILEIYEAIKNQEGFPEYTAHRNLQEAIKRLFGQLSPEERKAEDNVEALSTAMEMERRGYALYQQASEKASTPAEKAFYRSMQHEEGLHLEALENVYYYLTDTADWFASEESKVWNWMTT